MRRARGFFRQVSSASLNCPLNSFQPIQRPAARATARQTVADLPDGHRVTDAPDPLPQSASWPTAPVNPTRHCPSPPRQPHPTNQLEPRIQVFARTRRRRDISMPNQRQLTPQPLTHDTSRHDDPCPQFFTRRLGFVVAHDAEAKPTPIPDPPA